jgi:hypothetical protein
MASRYGIGPFEQRQWRDEPRRWREDDPDEREYRSERRDIAPSSDPWQSHEYERAMREHARERPARRDDERRRFAHRDEDEHVQYYRDERGTDDYFRHELRDRRDDDEVPFDDRYNWPDRRPRVYTPRAERFGHPSIRGSRIDYDQQFVSSHRDEDEDRCENCGHVTSRRRER